MKPKNKKKIWISIIILVLIGAVALWLFNKPQSDIPEFALDIQINKSPIDSIVPAVEGTITLLHNGEPVSEISKDWGWHYAPKIKASIRPVMDDDNLQLFKTPKVLTSFTSLQLTNVWNYDFENGTDTLVGEMDFSDGKIEFNYIYGASHLYPKVEFSFDAVVDDGLTLSNSQIVDFGKLARAITQVPNINKQTRGSFYYDISFESAYKKWGIDFDTGSFLELIRQISVKITVRDSITNQIIDNPYQRVQVTFYPVYTVNDFDISFELAGYVTDQTISNWPHGALNPYLAETFNNRFWYAFNEIPRGSFLQQRRSQIVEIDLINGEGKVIYQPNNHYADIKMLEQELPEEFKNELEKVVKTANINKDLNSKVIPNVLVVVRPANYGQIDFSVCSDFSSKNLIENPLNTPNMSPGAGPGGRFRQFSYRNENKICYPDRPEPKDDYTFLYKTWQKNDLLTDRIYTVATLPLRSNATTISDKIIEIISEFTEQVRRFNFFMWFITSQIAQLIIGGLMIIIKRRNELKKKKIRNE